MDQIRDGNGKAMSAARHHDWLNVLEAGAVGDGSASCTAALQRAIDRCAENGGGTVFIPAGKYVTGTLWLRSNIILHLDAGATILGQTDLGAYPIWTSRWEGPNVQSSYAPLIAGEGLTNVALTGRGVIDGRGQFWWDLFHRHKLSSVRPNLLRMVDCRDVLIDGNTFINSPRWTLNPTACENLTITNVTIRNPHDSPNTDGINPDSCSNVHISNCHIDVGDDCITIKSGSEEDGRRTPRSCYNVTISNCTMLHGHGGVVIGSEMSGGVRNVAISNCVFYGTERGIRLKSRRGRGNAVEDLRVDNIVMNRVLCPIVLNMFYVCGAAEKRLLDPSPQPVNAGTPQFRRLRFSNITAREVKYAAAFILGLPEMFVDDIVLDGISIYLDPNNKQGGSPAMTAEVLDMCRAGLVLKNARNVKLRRIDIYDQLGPAVIVNNSQDILVSDLYASMDGQGPLVLVDGVDSSAPDEDDTPTDGPMPPHHDGDGRRVRTFIRGRRFGRRSRNAADAALSKLTAESSPDLA
ncbi:MAG TPA: glycoside hydrolase family 28 protein [Tepidisphaeraceae bacterium]|jgi:polygalacturonase|nr:glycoside hydrolase family 28 protein [Tepidisphaeraceae bacterium]